MSKIATKVLSSWLPTDQKSSHVNKLLSLSKALFWLRFFHKSCHACGLFKALSDSKKAWIDGNFKSYIKRKALGVVFVIAPWNYPYLVAVNSIIPAMAAGNSVILKHSAQTPLCSEQLYQSAKKILPKDIFNYLHLNHEDSLKIVSDKRINFVSFTGSVKAGYDVQRATQNKFIDMTLELGGKDPAYARYDCDLEKTVENLVDGSFFNSGQSCCGIERIYVDEKIYNNFLELFVSKTYNYKLGNPLEKETNLGPVVDRKSVV